MNEGLAQQWPVCHFVITRFNVRSTLQGSEAMIEPAYLAHRLEMFEQFCLPTLRGQSRQDFTWLVLFSEDTPSTIRHVIESSRGVLIWAQRGKSGPQLAARAGSESASESELPLRDSAARIELGLSLDGCRQTSRHQTSG